MENVKWKERVLYIIAIVLVLYLQHIQLSYATAISIPAVIRMKIVWQLINCLIISIPFLFILLISKRIQLSLLISSTVMTILSISDYYVLLFHGSPFFAGDIYSARTAFNVLSEYSLSIDSIIIRLLVLFGLELIIITICSFFLRNAGALKIKRRNSSIILLLDIFVLWNVFFSPWTLFPNALYTWSWASATKEYGYELVLMNSAYLLNHKLIIPDGYSADLLKENEHTTEEDNALLPDVILILNETLCDLSVYTGIPEGREVLAPLYDDPEIIHGYSTASLVGGGTNNSEYELLTSNSMSGLSVSAPFLFLNLTKANSLVSYLENLNYSTAGMHSGDKSNYGRNTSYYGIGFDKVCLGRESFNYFREYGNRPWLDEDNYRDMIEVYDSFGDNPRFMYLLTYQNHGGYEQNDPEMDLISVSKDFGDYTDDVNEFLSTVSKSADAFIKLKEHFVHSERPVIILMVGDHAPSFIQNIPAGPQLKRFEEEIALRTVPYFVWANYDIDESVFSQKSSMVDLVPMMLKSIGAPLTDYYQTILDLNETVPIRTYTGMAEDSEGNIFRIEKGEPYYDQIQNYLYLEYNNLLKGSDYKKELFELEK